MEKFEGLTGIDEYLSRMGDGCPVSVPELDHIIKSITAHCSDLNEEQATRLLSLFFQEIRSAVLQGKVVDIRNFGSFFITSPRTDKNKEHVFLRFKPKRSLIKKLNHGSE